MFPVIIKGILVFPGFIAENDVGFLGVGEKSYFNAPLLLLCVAFVFNQCCPQRIVVLRFDIECYYLGDHELPALNCC
jgi:hypothetical protein